MDEILQEAFELEEDTQKGKFLTFCIDNEIYGLDVMNVTEIVGVQTIAKIPELPDYIKGIMNLRGKIIPVMDIRLRFKKEAREYDDKTCIVVIDVEDITMGLIVDRVSEVLFIKDEDIIPLPELNKGSNRFTKGIGKVNDEVKLIIDCDKLLNYNDEENLLSI